MKWFGTGAFRGMFDEFGEEFMEHAKEEGLDELAELMTFMEAFNEDDPEYNKILLERINAIKHDEMRESLRQEFLANQNQSEEGDKDT